MSDSNLEQIYREHLDEDIVFCLSERKGIPADQAMRMYYSSKIADRIHEGQYGIQYLSSEVLADYVLDEIVSKSSPG